MGVGLQKCGSGGVKCRGRDWETRGTVADPGGGPGAPYCGPGRPPPLIAFSAAPLLMSRRIGTSIAVSEPTPYCGLGAHDLLLSRSSCSGAPTHSHSLVTSTFI